MNSANGEAPELVELDADQYRAAIIGAPIEGATEYIVWAANSSQMALAEGNPNNVHSPWLSTSGKGEISAGADLHVVDKNRGWPYEEKDISYAAGRNLLLAAFHHEDRTIDDLKFLRQTDGTHSIIVTDDHYRSIADIQYIHVRRGDFERGDDEDKEYVFWRGSNISDHFKEKAEDGDVRNILNAFESVDADAGLVTIRSNLLGTPVSLYTSPSPRD